MRYNFLLIFTALFLITLISGCETLRGAGKDMENAGKSVQGAGK